MLSSAGQILCRGPKHFDEAKGSLMDRPDSHGAAPSRADQIEQQPVLRIIVDMVAGFCTGARCACCILRTTHFADNQLVLSTPESPGLVTKASVMYCCRAKLGQPPVS